jgi:hypothetical protein
MKEQQQVEVTVRHGIVEDYRGTGLRQVTLLDAGQWQQVVAELGVDLPWHTRRAIGECRFAIGGETTPCQRMDELQPGLRGTLTPEMRGGVWGKVLSGGQLRVGDSVRVFP